MKSTLYLLGTVALVGALNACAHREYAHVQSTPKSPAARLYVAKPVAEIDTATPSSVSDADHAPATDLMASSVSLAPPAIPVAERSQRLVNSNRTVSQKIVVRGNVTAPSRVSAHSPFSRQSAASVRSAQEHRVSDTTTNGISIAALVCGIVAFFVFGIILGVLAIVFGAIGLSNVRKNPDLPGRGRSLAGLILGIVATIAASIVVANR